MKYQSMKVNTILGVILSLTLAESQVIASAMDDGEKISATCIGCHGKNGISSNPLWPNLAGQKKDYLVKQIKAFKSGERKNHMMEPISKTIKDIDIESIALYFSSQSCEQKPAASTEKK